MSTMVQPFWVASSSALSRATDGGLPVVRAFPLAVGMVDETHEPEPVSGGGPLEHLEVTVRWGADRRKGWPSVSFGTPHFILTNFTLKFCCCTA